MNEQQLLDVIEQAYAALYDGSVDSGEALLACRAALVEAGRFGEVGGD